jgi:hypothetical protein
METIAETALRNQAPVSLATGPYRLSLAINRERWSTTDAPDALNRYQDSAQLIVTL